MGHSTKPLDLFLRTLQAHDVTQLVDVRTVPRSRRHPQFNRESLPESLKAVGIGYMHMPGLGGFRRPRPDSPNAGWENASFRGYADYMQTPEFQDSLEQVLATASENRSALMCAEAVPGRCHRSLIADALVVRGAQVEHVMNLSRRQRHELTPWAEVNGMWIVYPPNANQQEPV